MQQFFICYHHVQSHIVDEGVIKGAQGEVTAYLHFIHAAREGRSVSIQTDQDKH